MSRIGQLFLDRASGRALLLYALAVAALCVSMAILGFRITSATNHNTDEFDQGAYIQMSGMMRSAWYPWYTDGTRNPLFPWLAARVVGADTLGFFESGKKLNVLFGVAGTLALAAFFACRMGPLAAFNATALAGLGALLPISTFFGAEVLFFVLFLFVCVCAMRLLNDNPPWLYTVLGLLAGLAWLAKPSATPFIGLFIVFSLARLVFGRMQLPWHLRAPSWSARNFFIGMAFFGAVYFALISPRLVHAQRTWGSAFYSLPSFWFWADDWETCVEKYTDCRAITLAKMPPEEQPTLAGYFRRHTAGDAIQRAAGGATRRLEQFFHPEAKWRFPYDKSGRLRRVVLPHRGFYIIALGLLVASMAAFCISKGRLHETGAITLPVLLTLAMFVAYILAMGWYLPTGPGHRFIMTLFLPILWILAQGGDQLRRAASFLPANALFLACHATIAALVIWRVGLLLVDGNFEKISFAF